MAGLGTIYSDGPYSRLAVGAIRRGRAVKPVVADSKQDEECDTAGEASEGIAIHTKADGEQFSVQRGGQNEDAVCGAALATIGTELATDNQGRYVPAVADDVVLGRNLTTTANADELFTIQLVVDGGIVPTPPG